MSTASSSWLDLSTRAFPAPVVRGDPRRSNVVVLTFKGWTGDPDEPFVSYDLHVTDVDTGEVVKKLSKHNIKLGGNKRGFIRKKLKIDPSKRYRFDIRGITENRLYVLKGVPYPPDATHKVVNSSVLEHHAPELLLCPDDDESLTVRFGGWESWKFDKRTQGLYVWDENKQTWGSNLCDDDGTLPEQIHVGNRRGRAPARIRFVCATIDDEVTHLDYLWPPRGADGRLLVPLYAESSSSNDSDSDSSTDDSSTSGDTSSDDDDDDSDDSNTDTTSTEDSAS